VHVHRWRVDVRFRTSGVVLLGGLALTGVTLGATGCSGLGTRVGPYAAGTATAPRPELSPRRSSSNDRGQPPAPTTPRTGSPAKQAPGGPTAPTPSTGPAATAVPTAPASARATLAFGGDVHFEGTSRAGLTGDLGSAFGPLAAADAGFVNLETAITDRGSPGPKTYTFRAPASAMTVLRAAGIDAVTMANNHGEDYGLVGLRDSLAASQATGLPVIGAGLDDSAAYTPWRGTLHGIRVSAFGATDVLDDYAVAAWPATATRPGLASSKDETRLLAAVRAERARADVVVVFLHWGRERVICPTARQQQLAHELAGAGASLLVGSHAHVQQPQRMVDGIPVFYGLGNFHFYARGGAGSVSGVATVTVGPHGVLSTGWVPARIVSGAPHLLAGAEARSAVAAFGALCPAQ